MSVNQIKLSDIYIGFVWAIGLMQILVLKRKQVKTASGSTSTFIYNKKAFQKDAYPTLALTVTQWPPDVTPQAGGGLYSEV